MSPEQKAEIKVEIDKSLDEERSKRNRRNEEIIIKVVATMFGLIVLWGLLHSASSSSDNTPCVQDIEIGGGCN